MPSAPSEKYEHRQLRCELVLLRTRWIVGHLLVIVVAGGFVALGVWQLNRNTQKHDKVKQEEAAYAAPAPPITASSEPVAGTRAQATGTFLPTGEALLRNQVRGASPGVDVLTPLRLADGSVIYVDRGYVKTGLASGAPSFAPPPTGTVVATGIVQPSVALSAQDTVRIDEGRVSVPAVNIARIVGPHPTEQVHNVWLSAQAIEPVPRGSDVPKLPEPPAPDPVNHFEYAIEWFAFAAIPLIGWPIVLWQISRRQKSTTTASPAPPQPVQSA
jgi:cytochrome oxidase assembly protein ShyY1